MQDTSGRYRFVTLARAELATLPDEPSRGAFVLFCLDALENAFGRDEAAKAIREITAEQPPGTVYGQHPVNERQANLAMASLLRFGILVSGDHAVITPDWAWETGGSA